MEDSKNQKCGNGEFNYCFWAKFIIGVPVVFIVSYIAASFFTGPLLQVWAGSIAGILTVYIAMKIDKIPALQSMIVKKKE